MRVLGIDPGLTRCGVGLVDSMPSRRVSLILVDTYRSEPSEELSARIGLIAVQLEDLIVKHKPEVIALERVFSQQNLKSVMGTAQISGVVLMLANKHRIPISLHTPTEVKAAVTGSGRANKNQVGQMVAKILGLAEIPSPADAADALAIAICRSWKSVPIDINGDESEITPAQKAWMTAERAASKKKWR
ncbi:MAG: crossover junction endodeoxyribonuclease RuvC [Rhodoluna sp.]